MTVQQTLDRFTRAQLLIDLADEAAAYLKAKDVAREKRQIYRRCRDQYLYRNQITDTKWGDLVDDRAFQMATGKPYREWRKARRQQYNAERRMERRFRKLILEGAVK